MAKQTRSNRGTARRSGGGLGRLLLGIVLGVALSAAGIVAYFYFGNPPVGVADRTALWEPLLIKTPVNARARSAAKPAPFPASEDAFEGAARTYRVQCVSCHGAPGHDAAVGHSMLPRAPQFFALRDRRAIAAQSPGEIYWKTAFGIRRSGMPAYNRSLTDTQLWQISLLLHAASDDLPDPVRKLLTEGVPPPQPSLVQP